MHRKLLLKGKHLNPKFFFFLFLPNTSKDPEVAIILCNDMKYHLECSNLNPMVSAACSSIVPCQASASMGFSRVLRLCVATQAMVSKPYHPCRCRPGGAPSQSDAAAVCSTAHLRLLMDQIVQV